MPDPLDTNQPDTDNPVSDHPDTDQSLVSRIRQGDDSAATELYHRYAGRVLGLVDSQMSDLLRANVESEDVVQSVFKSFFRGMDSRGYDAPQRGTLWHLLAVISIHKVRKNAARRSAEKRDVRRTQSLDDLAYAPSVGGNPDISGDSVEVMEVAMRDAIENLRPQEQEVVALRIAGYSIDEIAEKVGMSPRTIERRLQQARDTLTDLLSES